MGKLNWDIEVGDGNDYCFVHPDKNIEELASDSVALAAIEESYITEHTSFYNMPDEYFARGWDNKAVILKRRWFGREAKMVDWSNEEAGAHVFKEGRFPSLVSKGIHFHWTDLGEPEHFEGDACYHGFEGLKNGEEKNRHPDIHNLYNLMWNKSIYDGYCHCSDIEVDGKKIRHFILTRSGAAGTQRLGTAVWSGDIASDPKVLATHLNAQLHISLCGIDYYGSDVGGFRRENIDMNNEDEMYTQWFANSAWFDVPLRPHVDNAFVKVKEGFHTAPNKVGHRPSNLYNLRRRYELIPYYYSLAFRAFLEGEPVIPPLVYAFPDDKQVRTIGHEKLVGPFILVGVVAAYGETARNVYLPAGTRWVNAHTGEWFDGGQEINQFPVYFNGILTLPVFYKEGAIIPGMHVDEQTMDVFGTRKDGSVVKDLIVTVAPGRESTTFTLYEDDGRMVKYNNGAPEYNYQTTKIEQLWEDDKITVTIGRTEGTYRDNSEDRKIVLTLMLSGKKVAGVLLNGENGRVELDSRANGVVVITSKSLALDMVKKFEITVQDEEIHTGAINIIYNNSGTRYGEQIYIVGNIPQLGNGNLVESNRLDPVYYKNMGQDNAKWMKYITGLPLNSSIIWKLVRKLINGSVVEETGEGLLKLDKRGFNGSIKIN
jgi:alpha-glucosidase